MWTPCAPATDQLHLTHKQKRNYGIQNVPTTRYHAKKETFVVCVMIVSKQNPKTHISNHASTSALNQHHVSVTAHELDSPQH